MNVDVAVCQRCANLNIYTLDDSKKDHLFSLVLCGVSAPMPIEASAHNVAKVRAIATDSIPFTWYGDFKSNIDIMDWIRTKEGIKRFKLNEDFIPPEKYPYILEHVLKRQKSL